MNNVYLSLSGKIGNQVKLFSLQKTSVWIKPGKTQKSQNNTYENIVIVRVFFCVFFGGRGLIEGVPIWLGV